MKKLLTAFLLLNASLLYAQTQPGEESEPGPEAAETEEKDKRSFFGSVIERFTPEEADPEEILESLPEPVEPRPFNIQYKVSLNGLPTGLKAEAKLRKQDEHYLFQLHAHNWVLSYFEKSAFVWNEDEPCKLQTESYQFTFEGFGHTDAFEVHVDQEAKRAHSSTQRGQFTYEVPGNVSDALAYLFKLQCDVSHQRLNPDYKIAYDDSVDHYIFKFRGVEKLRTSLGKLDTLVLERVYEGEKLETVYWIAPELDYLMVRMKHKQGKMVTATLKIREIDYDLTEDKETLEREQQSADASDKDQTKPAE